MIVLYWYGWTVTTHRWRVRNEITLFVWREDEDEDKFDDEGKFKHVEEEEEYLAVKYAYFQNEQLSADDVAPNRCNQSWPGLRTKWIQGLFAWK